MYSVKNQNDDEVDQSFGEAIVGLRARGASWPQLTTFTNDKVTMMMMMTMTMMMAMVMMVMMTTVVAIIIFVIIIIIAGHSADLTLMNWGTLKTVCHPS